jgi:hypothetical protein
VASIIGSELDYEIVSPNAAALIESIRAVGYSVQTSLADLVDNSIAALARNVWVNFHWHGMQSYVSVADDGRGMLENKLTEAMRLGSRSPLDVREPHDLGRFGLGLKTASFSQCRRLTVWTKAAGSGPVARCWDLDYVQQTGDWRLLKEVGHNSADPLAFLGTVVTGTVVIWERLDRLVEGACTEDQAAELRFLRAAEQVEQHMSMVFHRFLEPPAELRITVNDGNPIAPWDPFLKGENGTQQLAEEALQVGEERVTVRPYVLPHHSRLSDQAHKQAGGPGGWNAHQGFYVYRNRRLLVPGDWLQLGFQKEEHFKLARIQVDIPTTLDNAWQIDVKKSTARPPGGLRTELRRIAKVTRNRACEVYRHRGKTIARANTKNECFVWSQLLRQHKISYRINREHPLVKEALVSAGGLATSIESLIRLVEETVPVPLISIDTSQNPDCHAGPFECSPESEVRALLNRIYCSLRASGVSHVGVLERLSGMEPFDHFPHLIATLEESET